MGNSSLAFWSAVAFIIRLIGLLLFGYIARVQFNEFQYRSELQPLKRLLFCFVIAIFVTSLPILFLNFERVTNHTASPTVTSIATVTNAAGLLLSAVLLYMVYKYKGDS